MNGIAKKCLLIKTLQGVVTKSNKVEFILINDSLSRSLYFTSFKSMRKCRRGFNVLHSIGKNADFIKI